MLEYYQVFFGAVLVLTIQSVPVGLVNLRQSRTSNQLLGFIVLLFALSSLRNTLLNPWAEVSFVYWLRSAYIGSFYDPLLFLYLLSFLRPLRKPEIKYHLLAPVLILLLSILINAQPTGEGDFSFVRLLDLATAIYTLIYAFLGMRLILINKHKWSTLLVNVRRRVIAFYGFLLLYFLYVAARQLFSWHTGVYAATFYYIDSIYYLLVFMLIPVYGYSEVTDLKKWFVPKKTAVGFEVNMDQTINRLNDLLDNQEIFRRPGLKIDELASELALNKEDLSLLLKNTFNTTFQQLINEKRLDCFKKEAKKPENRKLDITGIAMSCGFSSRASFYRIYKKHEAGNPGDLLTGDQA